MAFKHESPSVIFKSQSRSVDENESRSQCLREVLSCGAIVSQNYLGIPSPPFTATADEVYQYVLELCSELPDKFKNVVEMKRRIKQIPPRNDIILKTRIEELISDDIYSEYQYRFCNMFINQEEPSYTCAKQWRKRMNWDETFIFDVNDYEHDVMHYELWISKTEQSGRPNLSPTCLDGETPKEQNGCNGLCSRLYAYIRRSRTSSSSSRMIAESSKLVKNFPTSSKQVILYMAGKKKNRLVPAAKLVIVTELMAKRTHSYLYHFRLHLSMLKMCYEKRVESFESDDLELQEDVWMSWTEILTVPALTLLHQHALQYGLDVAAQTLCSFMVVTALKENHENRISYAFIRSLLEELNELIQDNPLEDALAKSYRKSMQKFSRFVHDQLRDLHGKFSWKYEEDADELQEVLKCLLTRTDEAALLNDYQRILREEARRWYSKTALVGMEQMKIKSPTEDCIDVLKDIIRQYIENQGNLDEIFMRAWGTSYSSFTCEDLDMTMENTIKPLMKQLVTRCESYVLTTGQQQILKLLQVYHTIRHLVEYLEKTIPEQSHNLAMQSYPSWFGDKIILAWFILSVKKTEPVIKLAVAHDKMEELDTSIKHGTSVPDVKNIIDEMVVMIWLKLRWEDQLFTHKALVDAIQTCSTTYVKAVYQKMEDANFYSKDHPFKGSKQLCVALSSIHAIHTHTQTLNNRIAKAMAKAEAEHSFALVDIHQTMEYDIIRASVLAYQAVIKKMREHLKKSIPSIYLATNEREERKATDKVCDYLEENLDVFYKNLDIAPFTILLRSLWITCVDILYCSFKNAETFRMFNIANKSKKVSKLGSSALQSLYEVFHCRGKGLTRFEMENNKFKKLVARLDV